MKNEESPTELKLIQDFLKKNNIESHLFSEEDKEDYVLLNKMVEVDYNDIIDTDQFLKELRGN
jgi:hypothetical protein